MIAAIVRVSLFVVGNARAILNTLIGSSSTDDYLGRCGTKVARRVGVAAGQRRQVWYHRTAYRGSALQLVGS